MVFFDIPKKKEVGFLGTYIFILTKLFCISLVHARPLEFGGEKLEKNREISHIFFKCFIENDK
jgi:hypothetical protein